MRGEHLRSITTIVESGSRQNGGFEPSCYCCFSLTMVFFAHVCAYVLFAYVCVHAYEKVCTYDTHMTGFSLKAELIDPVTLSGQPA